MGGNNPLIVSQVHHLQAAAYLIIQSAYLSSGQRCTCARRLIVLQGEKGDQLIEALAQLISRIKVGSYQDTPQPFMGPVIHEQQVRKLLETQQMLIDKGGIPLVKMQALKAETGFISPGLMDVSLIKDRPDEEWFGPFLQLIRVKNFDEALEEANRTKFGLAAGLLSESEAEYEQFYREIQAGIVNWNMPLTGASSEAPFGGVKCSGNYRPSAYYAADYCAYPVASMESKTIELPTFKPPGLELE